MSNILSQLYTFAFGNQIIYGIDGTSGPNVDYSKGVSLQLSETESAGSSFSARKAIATINGLALVRYQAKTVSTNRYWSVQINDIGVYIGPLSRAGQYTIAYAVKRGDKITFNFPTEVGINDEVSRIDLFPYVNETYSLDEQVVGTWINGKTIYRRVIQGTTGPETNTWALITDLTENNPETIIKIEGIVFLSNGTQLPVNTPATTTIGGCICAMNGIKLLVEWHSEGACSSVPITIIVEYTKKDELLNE